MNTQLPLPSPDFINLKAALKTFMSTYDGLTDYNYDGSVLSIFLDTLAYNTHLQTFWLNMVANEAFIQTAKKRHNIVKAAADLGYVPQSAKSAQAELNVELEPIETESASNFITIKAGTIFTATSPSAVTTYNFSTTEDHIAYYNRDEQKYMAYGVKVFEGRLLVHTWTVVAQENLGMVDQVVDVANDGVSIPNLNVDTSTMKVFVNEATEGSSEKWVQYSEYAISNLNLDKNSRIYFLSEDEFGRINVTFGNDKAGYKPKLNSEIRIVYLVTKGAEANGIVNFTLATEVQGTSGFKVTAQYPSGSGSAKETNDSIKYNARLAFESQGKAVVTGDYTYLVKQVYPNAKRVIAVGGQDLDPPRNGEVIICVQPNAGVIMTEQDKKMIAEFINKKNVATIIPTIINPDYTYLSLTTDVDCGTTSNFQTSEGDIKSAVIDAVKKYANNKLQSFDDDLNYSRLLSTIDNSSAYIKSNITNVLMSKRIDTDGKVVRETFLDFGNSIKRNSISSSRFTYGTYADCFFTSTDSKISIKRWSSGKMVTVVSDAGVIDLKSGKVRLRPLALTPDNTHFSKYTNKYYIKLDAIPAFANVTAKHNQILVIDNIIVNVNKD